MVESEKARGGEERRRRRRGEELEEAVEDLLMTLRVRCFEGDAPFTAHDLVTRL